MRVADRPVPAVTLHPSPRPWPASWPIRPVIAISLDLPYDWDDSLATWDADFDAYLWDIDQTAPQWIDATCDMIGLEADAGGPDDHFQFDAAHLTIELDNSTGAWSQWRADGSLSVHGPGSLISLYAHSATGDYWIFSGRIARWDERATGTVEIEAFDVFSDMAQPIGTYTPGAASDHPNARINAILSTANLVDVPKRLAVGTVALTRQQTDQSPLEESQTVVGSDGGALYGDADGTLVSYDRTWRIGRSDQTSIPVISDNVCSALVIIWDALLSSNDVGLADVVILENIARLQARASTTGTPIGRYVLSETEQQWTLIEEGSILAQFTLDQQKRATVQLESFDLYLLDPDQPTLWRAVDWRLFDRLRFVHDSRVVDGVTRLDLNVLVIQITHSITADQWIMTVGTTRALDYTDVLVWNTTQYVWNDASPRAVWGY